MRVLRITSVFELPPGAPTFRARSFDPVGGMQGHTRALTYGLDELGVAQTVLTARRPGAPSTVPVGRLSEVVRVGYPVKHLRQLWSLPGFRAARRLASGVDLVHVHQGEDLAAIPMGITAARSARVPLVLTIHCSLRHTLRVVDGRTAVLAAFGGFIERRGMGTADRTVVLTDRMAQRVAGIVDVIPPGVDTALLASRFDRPLPELDGPRVVYVGRLAPQKGVFTLLQAANLLKDIAARFVLVGDGPERPALERAIADAGLSSRVRIVGFVPRELAAAHMAHADIFVMPSMYEELGRALLEALHMGIPTIASRTGGMAELIRDGENGLLVAPGDPVALAGAIDWLLDRREIARRLGAEAKRNSRANDWSIVAERVMDLYSSVTRNLVSSPR